jgi:hypothetical protein
MPVVNAQEVEQLDAVSCQFEARSASPHEIVLNGSEVDTKEPQFGIFSARDKLIDTLFTGPGGMITDPSCMDNVVLKLYNQEGKELDRESSDSVFLSQDSD